VPRHWSAEPVLTVLLVCTGNICRSPAAQLLLAARLGPASGIRVSSAGLAARSGAPVAAPVVRLLRERGVDAGDVTARRLTPELVRAADLVLTMTAEQRAAVVTRVPAAVRRTFTLREPAGLAELVPGLPGAGDPPAALDALVRAVPGARALRRAAAADDDVPDPYGGDDELHARVLARIEDAVDRLAAVLTRPAPHAA
jgi:protein-tyrosine phosphatase